jgi:hypothetical protein
MQSLGDGMHLSIHLREYGTRSRREFVGESRCCVEILQLAVYNVFWPYFEKQRLVKVVTKAIFAPVLREILTFNKTLSCVNFVTGLQ